MTVLCVIKKLQIKEVPITFYERRDGKSKNDEFYCFRSIS